MSVAGRILSRIYESSLTFFYEADTETIALNPPTWIKKEHRKIWADVVRRGKHTNYGGAVNHFKRSLAKHQGVVIADLPVKGPADQSQTEKIANNPPRDLLDRKNAKIWADVVRRGGHTNYGGARAHFNAHMRKYGLAA